ncbi:hypothetical protein SLNWT_0252 [Streptomyces albus]|uniref:Uncharacterized protein n=1 Tax=Streptomyces albus (strain ATCC 21838 / DSM 41398 / FERM P-419 / JCM 4703 / NBRC 107858) TaxID=1081613 RepID=A0A0B5EF48_STRA4|nr:hypothetical protein SLNWT_0252 [Streptomyces albus]AOU74941.1 hypothetical protein SLNHY_0250 [Streptomyces albus]
MCGGPLAQHLGERREPCQRLPPRCRDRRIGDAGVLPPRPLACCGR